MTPDRFRELLDLLQLGQVEAAFFLGYDQRSVRRWAAGHKDIPAGIAMLLEMMITEGYTVEEAEALLDAAAITGNDPR